MPRFSVPSSLRSWVEIDTEALRKNLAVVQRQVGDGVGILAVVKANAYGHGAKNVVRALADGVSVFGVANLCEAIEVGSIPGVRDVMILSPCLPGEHSEAVERGFIVTVSSAAEVASFARRGRLRVNFKVDTAMGRAGVWWESAEDELRATLKIPQVEVHSISTHLPASDEDTSFTRSQLEGFRGLAERLRSLSPGAAIHSLNSAGILQFPEFSESIVRAGLILYGVSPAPEFQGSLQFALAWKTRLALVRDLPRGASVSYGRTFVAKDAIRVGLLPIGYADGLPRAISGRGAEVLVRGKRCPIIGRVTMDQVVVDLSRANDAIAGDEVVVIGRQGAEKITATELARQAGTIPWEIFTGIQDRVARVYPTKAAAPDLLT